MSAKGNLFKSKGTGFVPCDIAVLASLGIGSLKVFRKPLVVIIPTGEELVQRGKKDLKAGEVYETNGLMASMYIKKWGCDVRLLNIVTDSPDLIKEAILSNLDADMVITSGGTSVGKRDYVPAVVDR